MRMNLDHVASGHFVPGRDVHCEFDYWPLAVSMPPTKVCPQCKAAVPVRRKTCERCDHVFRSKRKAECNLREKAMKRMRSVESDSLKSARKAKDNLHKACERASETGERTLYRQELNRMRMASMRDSETFEQTVQRKEGDRMHKASMRESETFEQTVHRQETNRMHMASMRESETFEQTVHRQETNRMHMASMRESETFEQTVHRQETNRMHMASMRESETFEQTVQRKERDRMHKASMRASEIPDEVLRRKQSNKEAMASKRKSNLSVEHDIFAFHHDIKSGPDFVCTCCHRMMYRKSVVPGNLAKYSKCSNDLLQNVFSADHHYISNDGNEWVCKTCDRALKRRVMPLQAKANGLQLCNVPPELSDLNALELRLISLRVPFMKMVALPSGKQRSIHGPAVNVPSKVDTICDVLPRLPSQSELVPLKLKRKVAYRGHYMYDYITPQKLLDALRFLKANNPLYADIDVNEQWVEAAMANNEELCKHLVERDDEDMDAECEQPENDGCDNSSHTNVAVDEESEPMELYSIHFDSDEFTTALCQLKVLAHQNNFAIHDVPYDGNCMFSAVSYQLQTSGVCNVDSSDLRQKVADHLEANPPLYCDFLSQPVSSDDSYNADTDQPTADDEYINSVPNSQLQTELRWRKYLRSLRHGAWGDHITMQGIADMLCVKINVLSSHHSILSVAPGTGSAECEISVGLIMQYHYVGLETSGSNVEQNAQPTNDTENALAADALDDATIEEGDEHRRQISGAPMASMMCLENPESFRDIICVAPAEGERPLNIMTDPNFEAMSNPDKFPFGNHTFSSERPKNLPIGNISIRDYWMLMADLLETSIICLLLSTL